MIQPATGDVILQRLREMGIWDEAQSLPKCGWDPFIQGWLVVVVDDCIGAPALIVVNGVPWRSDVPKEVYAARAQLYR